MITMGRWTLDCSLADGARIGRLQFDGIDLLTRAPAAFRPPAGDYGDYELRPVYGYDDCFPTVDRTSDCPDHGELCWLAWEGSETECSVRSVRWPVSFHCRLDFGERTLTWSFRVTNRGDRELPFLHVMHPLMPLDQVVSLELPVPGVAQRLLGVPRGQAEMLYLPGAAGGSFAMGLRAGLKLRVTYAPDLFPTLAIWWNNGGYPNEAGLRRCECAFEPAPGKTTRLSDGTTLAVEPGQSRSWQVVWDVTSCR